MLRRGRVAARRRRQGPVDAERLAEPGRPGPRARSTRPTPSAGQPAARPVGVGGPPASGRAPAPHRRAPRPPAAGPPSARPPADRPRVHAKVHAVGEVDVGMTGRPEHHGIARRLAAERVRARIGRARVGLDLDQPHRDQAVGAVVPSTQPSRSGATSVDRAGRRTPRHSASGSARSPGSHWPPQQRDRSLARSLLAAVGNRVAGLAARCDPRPRARLARRGRSRGQAAPATALPAPVPPRLARAASAPRTDSTSRTSGVSSGEILARSASLTSPSSHSCTWHHTTRWPATSCASRNGTPRRTSNSAMSVASAKPGGAAVPRAGRRVNRQGARSSRPSPAAPVSSVSTASKTGSLSSCMSRL